MDFRGTYTPLHAFREAYAKARAIGVGLSDSSSSDSDIEDLMPSPRTGRQSSVSRVTAFSPKALVPVKQAVAARISSPVGQYQSPSQLKQARCSESALPVSGAAEQGAEVNPERAHVALQGKTAEQGMHHRDVLRASSAVVHHSNTHLLQAVKGKDVLLQASSIPQPDPSLTEGLTAAAPVPLRPAAVPFGQAAMPSQRVEPSPKAAAQRFRPAAVPIQIVELPSAAAAEPLRPAQVPSEPAEVPSRPTAGPFRPAAVPIRPAERPTQIPAEPFQSAQVPSGSITVPSEALDVPLNSTDAGVQTVKGPFENTQMPFKPAQLPTVTAKVSTKAAADAEDSKQYNVALSLEQPKQQSAVHQAHKQATSSGNPAALHIADSFAAPSGCHAAAEVFDQRHVTGPATALALKHPATKAGLKAELPVTALEAKAGASTTAPAQHADLPMTPSAAKAIPRAELMSKPATGKAPVSSSPAPLKPDLPVSPPAAMDASQASSEADLSTARQAVQQPSRSGASSSSASVQGNTVFSEFAGMAAQMDVAQSPTFLGKPADSRTNGELPDKMSLALGKQSVFPRARRPIVSAAKASVLSLQSVTTEVAVAGKTDELAGLLVQQAGAVLPDGLRAGLKEELAQKPAIAGRMMKTQIPKLSLVQVMPVAVSVTLPARSKQPAAAARTLSPSLAPPSAVPSFSPMPNPIPPAVTEPSVVTADSPVISPPSPSVVPSLLSEGPVADTVKQGVLQSGVKAASPAVLPNLAQAVTPEPSRHLASRSGSKSASAQKPPLHPQGSLTPIASKLKTSVTPVKQASPTGRSRSSPSSRKACQPASPDPFHEAAGKEASLAAAKVTEGAAELAAVLQGRVPLLCKGLTRQQYAALQLQRATKGPREALAFQYPSGFPWLPEKEQQAFEAAAAAASAPATQEAATAAAASVKSTASAVVQPLQLPKIPPEQQSQLDPGQAASLRRRDVTNESELPPHQQQAEPFKAAVLDQDPTAAKATPEVPGASPGAPGMAVPEGVREAAARAETSPDAGRGSEGGVGPSHTIGSDTRDAQLLGGYSQAVPPPAERGAPLSPDKKGTEAQGQPRPLMTRPSKAQLAGSPSVQSPRAPWEIKASTAATTSPLAKRHAATPGMGSGSAANKNLDGQDSLTAALSKKAQQRRGVKLAKHTPKGQGRFSWSRWLTAVLLMALCGGKAFMLAPPTALPPPAASCQLAVSGLAEQAASKLPPLVSLSAQPHPYDQQHPADTPSWEQHITQGPLQVWHQATSAVMSSLPTSCFPSKASQQGAPAEAAAGDDEPGATGLHAWCSFQSMSLNNLSQGVGRGLASCWRACQRAAEGLPQLVPKKGLEEGNEQVGPHWDEHAMAAPGELWRQFMTSCQKLPEQLMTGPEPHRLCHRSVPKAAGALLTKTGLWLLEGLHSAGELAGLSSEPSEQEMDTPSLPVYEGDHEAVETSAVTEQQPSPEPTEVAYKPKAAQGNAPSADAEAAEVLAESLPAETEATMAEPAVAEAETAVVEAEPAVADAEPAVTEAEPAVAEARSTDSMPEWASLSKEITAERKQHGHLEPASAEHVITDQCETESPASDTAAAGHVIHDDTDTPDLVPEAPVLEQDPQVDGTAGIHTFSEGPEQSATHDAVPKHAQSESAPADDADSEPRAHAHEPEVEPGGAEAEAEIPSTESELGAHVTEADAFKAPHAARTEHGPATNPLSAVSQSKLQQLVAWASDRHRFSRPADSSAAAEQTAQSIEKHQDQIPSQLSNQPAAVENISERTSQSEPAEITPTDSKQHGLTARAEQHADSASGAVDFQPQHSVDSSVDQPDSFEQIADVDTSLDESSQPDTAKTVPRFLKSVIWTAVPAFVLVLIWLLWPRHSSSSGDDGSQDEAADEEEVPEAAEEVQEASPAAQESSGPVTRSRAAASSVRRSISRAASQARTGMKAALGSGSGEGQEADSAPGGSCVGVDGGAPEGSGSGADGSAPKGAGVGPDGGSPVRSGSRTGGRARKSRLNRELAALGGNTIVDTPRSARRFTVDSYDGRRGNISKFHRLNTLTPNVDTLDLRDGTILTPNDYEMAKAAENRELQSLKS
ncbi:hypothetical protein WJX77_009787 [Trebouxia sp. C0004]